MINLFPLSRPTYQMPLRRRMQSPFLALALINKLKAKHKSCSCGGFSSLSVSDIKSDSNDPAIFFDKIASGPIIGSHLTYVSNNFVSVESHFFSQRHLLTIRTKKGASQSIGISASSAQPQNKIEVCWI
jgi:hypothetical protein